jgi:hypothetical protein
MDVKAGRMVFLGYGKYWRSDEIVGLVPVDEDRGPGRRTQVFVQDKAQPIVASRTEQSILRDMAATDEMYQAQAMREALGELVEAWHGLPPVLRRVLQNEGNFDVDKWETRLGTLLKPPAELEPVGQNELFEPGNR